MLVNMVSMQFARLCPSLRCSVKCFLRKSEGEARLKHDHVSINGVCPNSHTRTRAYFALCSDANGRTFPFSFPTSFTAGLLIFPKTSSLPLLLSCFKSLWNLEFPISICPSLLLLSLVPSLNSGKPPIVPFVLNRSFGLPFMWACVCFISVYLIFVVFL